MKLTEKDKQILDIALESWKPEHVAELLQYPLNAVIKYNRILKETRKPPYDEEAILKDYLAFEDGIFTYKTAQIYAKYDIPDYQLRKILRKHNVKPRLRAISTRAISDSKIKELLSMRDSGIKASEIINKSGLPRQKVYYILRTKLAKQQENK